MQKTNNKEQDNNVMHQMHSISKTSSPLKLLSHMNRNLVGSIYMYERFCIKFPQSRMKGEQHIQKKTQHDFGNPGAGLEQAQSCGRVKLINGIPILCS
jgi:hypothetical protein